MKLENILWILVLVTALVNIPDLFAATPDSLGTWTRGECDYIGLSK